MALSLCLLAPQLMEWGGQHSTACFGDEVCVGDPFCSLSPRQLVEELLSVAVGLSKSSIGANQKQILVSSNEPSSFAGGEEADSEMGGVA